MPSPPHALLAPALAPASGALKVALIEVQDDGALAHNLEEFFCKECTQSNVLEEVHVAVLVPHGLPLHVELLLKDPSNAVCRHVDIENRLNLFLK